MADRPVPASPIRAPVVVAARREEAAELVKVVSTLGGSQSARHEVDDRSVVIEFRPEADHDPFVMVRDLRGRGYVAIDGPRSVGHAMAWGRRNAPILIEDEVYVCFPWTIFDRRSARLVVEIDPGNGFGAGGHPTTLLVLRWLLEFERQAGRVQGVRVLDVGCGSGVLAVTAAMLGATHVDALDIDPAAVVATGANAVRNRVDDRVRLVAADLTTLEERYDLVLANIHAEILIALAPDLVRLLSADGTLVLSGLSPAQTSRVVASLKPLRTVWTGKLDDWVALALAY